MSALKTLVREQLGPLGLAAVLMLAACVLFLSLVVQPLEQRNRALDMALQGRDGNSGSITGARGAGTRIGEFYAFFQRRETLTDWLAWIQRSGRRAGLQLPSATYESVDGGQRLTRYRVSVPLTGTYVQIRRFLMSVLDDIPVASLDQVSFRRTAPNAPQVDAEVTFTLYLPKP